MTKDETVEGSARSEQAHDAAGGPEEQEPDNISENARTLEEKGEEREGYDVGTEALTDKTRRRGGQGVNEESKKGKQKRRRLKLLQIQETHKNRKTLASASKPTRPQARKIHPFLEKMIRSAK